MAKKEKCDLCGDIPEEIFIHGKCHMSAPLQASIIGDEIILRCYLPECQRLIVKYKLSPEKPEGD